MIPSWFLYFFDYQTHVRTNCTNFTSTTTRTPHLQPTPSYTIALGKNISQEYIATANGSFDYSSAMFGFDTSGNDSTLVSQEHDSNRDYKHQYRRNHKMPRNNNSTPRSNDANLDFATADDHNNNRDNAHNNRDNAHSNYASDVRGNNASTNRITEPDAMDFDVPSRSRQPSRRRWKRYHHVTSSRVAMATERRASRFPRLAGGCATRGRNRSTPPNRRPTQNRVRHLSLDAASTSGFKDYFQAPDALLRCVRTRVKTDYENLKLFISNRIVSEVR